MEKKRIGIMLELMWPYRRHLDIFAGTQRYAQEHGEWYCEIDEFLHGERGTRSETEPIGSYEGLLARATPELARRAKLKRIPLVNVWFNSSARESLPGVFPDFAEVGREAARHLTERGFRQFGCLGGMKESAHKLMISAFHGVLSEFGAGCSCAHTSRSYYKTPREWSRFQRMFDEWIATWKPPVAIFVAFNDVTVRYLVHACRRNGLKVPDDVALITPSNEPSVGLLPSPSLSSVEVDYEQIGYRAARILDRIMNGDDVPDRPTLLKPTGIIARDSTDFFAIDDEVISAAMRFIERSSDKRIGVGDVAAASGVARRTLERRFELKVGRSVAAEIRRLRISKAKRLLVESGLMVKEIAWRTGFRDPIRMNEVFTREVGMSPGEFRERMRKGD